MDERVLQYEFEDFILLPAERLLLRRGGEKIPLKSKVFETLLTLVRRHGELLTKDDLMTEIWGYNYVEEGNLTQNIFTLRKIFEEKPQDHRFIVTVPGRGYRFVARVRAVTETKSENKAPAAAHNGNGHLRSLAVLPLKFLAPGESETRKYLALAIADSLITNLSAGRRFAVRSTESVFRYTETEKDAVTLGRELAVDIVLSGTLQTSEEKVRANFQLHETKTGETVWAGKFEVPHGDFFELQDSIAAQAAESLTTALAEKAPTARGADFEIYQKYLKYRFFWETRTEEGLLTALNGVRKITSEAPEFALGHVGIADTYLLLGHHLFLPPEAVYEQVRAAIDRALEADPNLAEAFASEADYHFIRKDWSGAERLHRKSIALKPDYASGRHWYCWFLIAMGRFDEALEQIELAQLIDNNSLYLSTIRGIPFCYQRRFDRAVRQFELVLEVDPNYKRALYYLAWAQFHSGDWEKGIAEFESVVRNEPIQQTIAVLGYCYGVAGMKDKARRMLARLDEIAAQRYVSPYIRAWVHVGLDDKEQALAELEKAAAENSIWLVWLNVDMQFAALRGEPRFQSLIDRLNFPV